MTLPLWPFLVGFVVSFAFSLAWVFRARILGDGPPPKGARWRVYAHHLGSYMHRWIFLTPWGSLRLHHILRSDADRHLHDHPFDFTSFLLTGGYTEGTFDELGPRLDQPNRAPGENALPLVRVLKFWPRFSIIRKRAEDAHLLRLERPVWTIVVTGPKRRRWGFHTEKGWIYYRDYSAAFHENAASTKKEAQS